MARPDKEQAVENLTEKLKRAKGIVLSDFSGLNVSEMTELRKRCRESEVEYLVVKNTLARFAALKAELEDLVPYLSGPNGFTFGYEDPLVPARVINGFALESEKLSIRAGIFEGGVIGPEDVRRIATLPARDVLLSRLLAQMNAPIGRFAGVLRSVLVSLVYTLTQVALAKTARGESASDSGSDAQSAVAEEMSAEADQVEEEKPQN
jgi:large subunit ribosomal protein L10